MRAATIGRILVAVALVALAVVGAAPARAGDPAADFRAATRLYADGDLDAAQAAFEAVAAADPGGPWADDALSEAANVAEKRGDLDAARRLWRRVVDEYPQSRQSRRARARLAAIEAEIGAGGQWLEVAEQHEAILRAAIGVSDPTPQARALAALVAAHPDYPRAPEARLWIGDTLLRVGEVDRALAAYRDAVAHAPAGDAAWRAGKALGDGLLVAGRFDDAEHVYRGLYGQGDALADRALDGALDDVARARRRHRLGLAAWLALGLGVLVVAGLAWRSAGGPIAALRGLARPPLELWYFLPVAVVLGAVAASGNQLVERAVRWILLGGLVTTWLCGAGLELARRRGRLRLPLVAAHLAVAIAAVASVGYLAVMHDRLIDMIAETIAHGHEGR